MKSQVPSQANLAASSSNVSAIAHSRTGAGKFLRRRGVRTRY